jgi:alkylation response protein AidB-like acyl-CoA dehydrogenase
MNLLPSSEQQELIDVTAAVLDKELSGKIGSGERSIDADTWQRCADLGWLGLGVSAADGGVGYSIAEETLVFRELGRALAPGPFLPSVVAVHVLLASGATSEARSVLEGRHRCGLMLTNTSALDAHEGDLALRVGEDGMSIHRVEQNKAIPCVDESLRLAEVVVSEQIARIPDGDLALRYRVLLSAMFLGIAEAARDRSVAYATDREQFGRPIGTFQAVKHRCADMAVRCEVALSQLHFSSLLVGDGRDDAGPYVTSALVLCRRAAKDNSAVNIQNHGGIGFTKELGAHRLAARSLVLGHACGAETELRQSLLAPERILFN